MPSTDQVRDKKVLPHKKAKYLSRICHTQGIYSTQSFVSMSLEMKQQVVLGANDGQKFLVDPEILKSKLVDNLINILPEDSKTQAIPLPEIRGHVVETILNWCQELSCLDRGIPPGKLADWHRASLPEDKEQLAEIIKVANFLEIGALIHISAQNLAGLYKYGEILNDRSFEHVTKLPQEIQNIIVQYIPPLALKKIAGQGLVSLTHEQQIHNHIWTSIMKKDDWYEAALALGANPILVGVDLEKKAYEVSKRIREPTKSDFNIQKEESHIYLVLSSMDWEGDLSQTCGDIRDYLQEFTFDSSTSECRMKGSNTTLNIWEAHRGQGVSEVVDVDNKLVSGSADGVRTTALLYLTSPIIRRLQSRQPPIGRVAVLCTDCVYYGKAQT